MVGQNKISFFVLVSSCPQLYHMNCFFFFFLLTNCLNRLTIGVFFPYYNELFFNNSPEGHSGLKNYRNVFIPHTDEVCTQ